MERVTVPVAVDPAPDTDTLTLSATFELIVVEAGVTVIAGVRLATEMVVVPLACE